MVVADQMKRSMNDKVSPVRAQTLALLLSLGTQHLRPITIDVAFTGSGEQVDASISLVAVGELWNWAGLIELTALELSLAAATVD